MHDRLTVRDAKQANKEGCKTGQKRETQDLPKVKDANQAKRERCMTAQK